MLSQKLSNGLIVQWSVGNTGHVLNLPIIFTKKKFNTIGMHQCTDASNFQIVADYDYKNNLGQTKFITNFLQPIAVLFICIGE